MSRIPAIDPTTATGATAELFETARRKMGAVPNVLRVLGLSLADAAPLLFVTHCSEDFTADSLLLGMQAPHLP